jgi:hypothetical protein
MPQWLRSWDCAQDESDLLRATRTALLDEDELLELFESRARQAVASSGPDDPRSKEPNRRFMVCVCVSFFKVMILRRRRRLLLLVKRRATSPRTSLQCVTCMLVCAQLQVSGCGWTWECG